MMGRNPFRFLTEDEIELWRAIAETVVPRAGSTLPSRPRPEEPAPLIDAQPLPTRPLRTGLVPSYTPPTSHPREAVPPLAPIERRYKRKVSQGQIAIGRVLDLHGLNQAEAHGALRGFLRRAQADDIRLVLVVTGKGRRSHLSAVHVEDGGILRRAVPHWLREADLRAIVLSFEEASQPHGGAGALYIQLRRRPART